MIFFPFVVFFLCLVGMSTLAEKQGKDCDYPGMSLRGSFNYWTADKMKCHNGQWSLDARFSSKDRMEFKFDLDGSWTTNWGDSNGDGVLDLDAGNIVIAEEGLYRITLKEKSKTYSVLRLQPSHADPSECRYSRMTLRGVNNRWRADGMMCRNGRWEAQVSFAAEYGNRFKFDHMGDWNQNWGDNNADGIADMEGEDIHVVEPGQYLVWFDDFSLQYGLQLKTKISETNPDPYFRRDGVFLP